MLPELTTLGLSLGTSTGIGIKAGQGELDYGASTTAAGVSTTIGTVSDMLIDSHYHNLIDAQKVETTTAYIQQLSDEELEAALIKYNLLDNSENDNVKVL